MRRRVGTDVDVFFTPAHCSGFEFNEMCSGCQDFPDIRTVVAPLHNGHFVAPILHGLMILVVDDDPVVRGLYVFVLQTAGATVISSALASEAVQLIDLRTPDAVVTDLQMPVRDGIWLLGEIRDRLPGVPVIAVSGHIDVAGLRDLQRLGFADVLAKPLGLSELTKAVARVVGR